MLPRPCPSQRLQRAAAPILCLTFLAGCIRAPGEPVPDLDLYRERLEAIENQDLPQTTWILDRNGELLAELVPEEGYRSWLPIEEIPEILQQAVVATEDRSFYKNKGFDRKAVARAALQNSSSGETVSGASTITMQLVRLIAFEPEERFEVSLERKIRELYLAAEVDEAYSKDEILEAYLNAAFFGNRALGIEAAAERYFGKSARELSPTECTLLAGLVQAPSALNPIHNFAGARARQRIVLESMIAAGYLSPTRAELIWMEPLRLADAPPQSERRARFFIDYLLQTALPEALGPELAARGGFTVTTTLDRAYDERLAELARDHVSRLRAAHNLNSAAVVALRPGSGEILAMVGGSDYDNPSDGQVNMAVSPRQLGSTFKPIAYATAMEAGMTPATVLWDVPYEFGVGGGSYKPVNYDGVYRGPVRLRYALANSMNAAAIDISAQLGVESVHAKGLELGLGLDPDPSQYGLSIVLGGGAVTLLEMVGAYASFADQGRVLRPTGILEVVSLGDGSSMLQRDRAPRQVFSPETAWLMSDILSDSEARRTAFGDGASLKLSRPAAVKTGTSNDFRDNTTIGYTPYLAVGVWTGNKDNQPMRNVLGITGAAPIWNAAMEAAFADEGLMRILGNGAEPRDGFERPTGLAQSEVCDLLTLTSGGECRRYTEWFPLTGLPEGRQPAFAAFTLGQEGASGARCAVATGGTDFAGASIMLNVARPPGMAATIRSWASSRGVRVAPPPCTLAQQGG